MRGDALELLTALAGVTTLSELAGPTLQHIQRLVGASASTVFSFDHRGAITQQGGSLARLLGDYPVDLSKDDPAWYWNLTSPPRRFLHYGQGCDLKRLYASRAYNDFYRPRDIGFLCGIWPTGLRFGASHMFALLLATPSPSRAFRKRDIDRLSLLEAPLRSAARRIARFRELGIVLALVVVVGAATLDNHLFLSAANVQQILAGSAIIAARLPFTAQPKLDEVCWSKLPSAGRLQSGQRGTSARMRLTTTRTVSGATAAASSSFCGAA